MNSDYHSYATIRAGLQNLCENQSLPVLKAAPQDGHLLEKSAQASRRRRDKLTETQGAFDAWFSKIGCQIVLSH
jgi:hypothetical protein